MKKYKISFFSGNLLCCSLIVLIYVSCSKSNYSTSAEYQFKSETNLPDYSSLNFWAAHPWKKDLSDSIPKPLENFYKKDSVADVFFIHPTTFTSKSNNLWNAPIDDAEINANTDYSSILYQASAFNEKSRVFAPRYRQAHIKAFFITDSISENAFDIAYSDVKAAFIYYLENYNNNRPIIIASHSQGTKHAARLLKEFFDHKPLQKKLICAYIIGLPVAVDYFTAIEPCKDSLSTGCIISWRTFKIGSAEPKYIATENFNSIVINPLSWTSETDFIPSSFNNGAVLKNFNKIIPKAVSAQIHHNVLWTSKPDVPGKIFLTRKNYHVGDINLFYMNIRENVGARINTFLNMEQK